MSVLYTAEDLTLTRTCALEFLPAELTRNPDPKRQFANEAKAASALQHNNICTVPDIDETPGGQFFIVMEYHEGTRPEIHSLLADGTTDPRPDMLARIMNLLGSQGSVFGSTAPSERGRIGESCMAYPESLPCWEKTESRVVDLLALLRVFLSHHIARQGNALTKPVLPAHTGKGCEEMAVSDGVAASREYVREAFGDEAPAERQEGRKRLEVHCEFDTSGMLAIVRQPQEMVSAA